MTRTRILALFSFLVPLGIFVSAAAPSVYWEDSAAFQTAAYELGIVHNPSFPIYILISRLFTLLPFGAPAFMANLTSAFFAASSCLLVFLITATLLKRFSERSTFWTEIVALLAALIVATSFPVWTQALRAEVYTFNLFLVLLTFWLVLKFHLKELSVFKLSALVGLITGAGLASHYLLFVSAICPIFLLTAFYHRQQILRLRPLLLFASFGLLALTVYFYLPIREQFSPLLNWGDFSTLGGALNSVLRFDEPLPPEALIPASPLIQRLGSVVKHVLNSISPILFVFSMVGLGLLFAEGRFVFWSVVLLLLSAISVTGYAAEFSVYNLDLFGYLALAYVIVGVVAAIGVGFLAEKAVDLTRQKQVQLGRVIRSVSLLFLMIPVALQFDGAFAANSKSGFNAADLYAEDIIRSLPPNSVFLAGEDNSFLPLLYKQRVEGSRPDVTILSGGALLRTDYRRKVQRRHSHLKYPAEWSSPAFAASFQLRLQKWIKQNSEIAPFAMTLSSWVSGLIPNLRTAGFIYVYQKEAVTSPDTTETDLLQTRCILMGNKDDLTTCEHFARLYFNRAVYWSKHGSVERAVAYTREAAATDSANPALLLNCAQLFAAAQAEKDLLQVAERLSTLDPDNKALAELLSRHYKVNLGYKADEQN